MRRRQIFFEQKLDAVGGRLQQAKRSHAGGSPAVLHVSHDLALEPNGVGNDRQQHEENQCRLNDRRQDVNPDWQRCSFLSLARYDNRVNVKSGDQSAATSAGLTS